MRVNIMPSFTYVMEVRPCTCTLGSFIMSKICGIALATLANPSFSHELAEKIKKKIFFGSWDVPHSIFWKISTFGPF